MGYLIFDVDRSTSSLGSPAAIQKLLGFEPVTISAGVGQINNLLARLTDKHVVPLNHDLFGDMGESEYRFSFKPSAASRGLEGVVIDSLSMAGYQERQMLQKQYKAIEMNRDLWGRYGDRMIKFCHLISRMDFPVVVTAHVKASQDENGGPIEFPDFKGASSTEAARYFDVIAYARRLPSKKGGGSFVWQIVSDGRRAQAKSRLVYPSETGIIQQDFRAIIDHYRDNGRPYPKIMIIGDSGSGKTTSLRTLVCKQSQEQQEEEEASSSELPDMLTSPSTS